MGCIGNVAVYNYYSQQSLSLDRKTEPLSSVASKQAEGWPYVSTHTVYQYKIQSFHYFQGIWPYTGKWIQENIFMRVCCCFKPAERLKNCWMSSRPASRLRDDHTFQPIQFTSIKYSLFIIFKGFGHILENGYRKTFSWEFVVVLNQQKDWKTVEWAAGTRHHQMHTDWTID